MSIQAVFNELKPVELPLSKIYLDPNNPRFIGTNSPFVEDDEIDSSAIQQEVQRKLVERFGVDKLRMNMEVNGYLPIDRVIVREFKPDKYVVLEGNRRICAAKRISRLGIDGSNVSAEVLGSLKTVPCLQYTGGEHNAAWIFQGIRHITGIVEWSAYNKAKLLVEQMEEENLSLTEAGKRFGLTSFGAGQWVRGYYAFKQAREESDHVEEVDEKAYPYFQELFSRSSAAVRDWMEWSEKDYRFKNILNFNEFIGWLYPKADKSEEDNEDTDVKGNFDKRYLASRDGIRDLAFLITRAPKAFEQFRREHDLEKATSMARAEEYEATRGDIDPVQELFEAIRLCTKAINNVPYRVMRNDETRVQVLDALKPLKTAISEVAS